ncbi:MAG: exodeoxyribonuclease V subunit alpha [Alcanivoracaceae bacterium]|nr:exodeoxyribonuclease V subunit alpha [Alcanivoracaceae bacterium]
MIAAQWLQQLAREKKIDALDTALAQQLYQLAGGNDENIYWLTALLSYQHRAGHVCIDLERPPAQPFDQRDCPWQVPALPALKALTSSALGVTTSDAPLVLDGTRIYLRRHWLCEQRISDAIQQRCQPLSSSPEYAARLSQALFSVSEEKEASGIRADLWQKTAALNCALHQFGVITGGPGTGKTWTVTRMLALHLFLAQEDGKPLPRIAMAAPTGKAAARLTEALQSALPTLAIDDALRAALPEEAVTLHRLLAMGMTGQPGYHAQRTLPFDVIVIDEASMVDLGLMAQLVDALDSHTALYLVGDRDQLASVQAGSVFADVCGNASNMFNDAVAERLQHAGCEALPVESATSAVDSAVVRLQTVHRFAGDSAIAALAEASRSNNEEAITALQHSTHDDLQWLTPNSSDIVNAMLKQYAPLISAAEAGADPATLLKQFSAFRALAATRRGPLGIDQLNAALELQLQRQFGFAPDSWFPGKAVLLKHNDWNLRLFNGDIGIAVMVPIGAEEKEKAGATNNVETQSASAPHASDPGEQVLRIAFPASDGGVKLIAPSRLPAYEPAWAMTIHKSQGSEFDQVLLVLPEDDSPVLTRELLYTGITRAKQHLTLATHEAQLSACLNKPVYRASGLHQRLRS